MTSLPSRAWLSLVFLCGATAAWAQCPPSCPNPGGGAPDTDCHAEFAGAGLRNNYPSFDPAKPKPAKEVRCFDGDAQCDLDGQTNNGCLFDIDVCLHNADPALPACIPSTVTVATVGGTANPELGALQTALSGLLPAATNVCTSGQQMHVPLKGPGSSGSYQSGKATVSLRAMTAAGNDTDKVKLVCVPRDWPSHGYNHANVHGSTSENILSPANANLLTLKWDLPLSDGTGNGVTATPTVGNGMVYVASWNGRVYGVKASNGAIKWSYNAGGPLGVQSSPALTADGRLVFGDSAGVLHCVTAKKGLPLWTNPIGGPLDHFWASAQVIGKRVFIGTASHSDNPCAPGKLFAFDLDTGTTLWQLDTVPAKICHNDTTITCSTDADCGGTPGTCIAGCGAGVTATVAASADGNTIYMGTVGSYTFPSIGDSETIFSINAATGAVNWKYRAQPGEQFADGPVFHDWGFLNGPMVIEGDDGLGGTRPLIVGAGKEGTLYALDLAGNLVWSRGLLSPLPDQASFGLFNGAIGWADNRIHAALYSPGASFWSPANDHFYAFNDIDGSTAWSAQIGESWAHIALANGLVFAGNNGDGNFYVHNAATGTRLNTLSLPTTSSSGASIVGGVVYVGYGIFGAPGGVRAFALP